MAELLHRGGRVLLGVYGYGCRVGLTARDVGLCAHRLAVRGVGWCLLAMEIPPAGAPLGAGFAVRQWLVGALDFWWVVPLRSG